MILIVYGPFHRIVNQYSIAYFVSHAVGCARYAKAEGHPVDPEDFEGRKSLQARSLSGIQSSGSRFHLILRRLNGNPVRDQAFHLKPLQMSSQLITQLRALETSLNEQAQKLQGLVNKGKEKAKHYKAVTEEARKLGSI